MKSLEHYKNQFNKAAERGLVDYQVGSDNVFELIRKSISAPGKTEKTAILFSVLKQILPEIISKEIEEKLKVDYGDKLPYRLSSFEFKGSVGLGGECHVFRLESKRDELPSYVIKLRYKTNKDSNEAVASAKESIQEYQDVREKYASVDGLIPGEYHIVVNNPKTKKPSVAIFQKYLGQDLKDVFKDFTKKEFVELLMENYKLREKFIKFVHITVNNWEDNMGLIDLRGASNLCIVEKEGEPDLIFLDPHNLSNKWKNEKVVVAKQEKLLEYLKNIAKLVE